MKYSKVDDFLDNIPFKSRIDFGGRSIHSRNPESEKQIH